MTLPPPITLSCGCFVHPVIENGVRTIKISPCKPDCWALDTLLTLAAEQDKPVEHRPS